MMDNRAQSIGIARFFLSLVAGAFVVWIVFEVTSPLLDRARETGSDERTVEATGWLTTGIDYLPLLFLLVAFFGLIALSIFQRERLRG